jgi:hypothetical protein
MATEIGFVTRYLWVWWLRRESYASRVTIVEDDDTI